MALLENGVFPDDQVKMELVPTRQGMPNIASNHQKTGEAWSRFSLTALRGNQLSDALILDVQPPGV